MNGRLDVLYEVADILKNKNIATCVRLLIAPAFKQVFIDAMYD